jgi:essential nuclear protein 1
MKPAQAQLFLSVVLLDAIREDIQSNKKLNVQYYECLKLALFKPAAFFKGIVFPMLEVGYRTYVFNHAESLPLLERLYP